MKDVVHVGKTFKKVLHSYKDVKVDLDGWSDAKKYLPLDFDMCLLKFEDKTLPGWYCGNSWDGKKVHQNDKVLYWKLKHKSE